jgi:NitT/TauT family transport system substrate-binding protein
MKQMKKSKMVTATLSRSTKLLASALALLTALAVVTVVQAQDKPEQLKLMLGDVSMNKLPFVMAYDEGIFKDNGLDMVPKFSRSSVEIIRKSGIDMSDEFILDKDETTPIRVAGAAPSIVGMTTEAGRQDMIILGSTHQIERWRIIGNTDIRTPEQLKGKRIGYSGYGAVSHMAAISFAQKMGWDPQYDWSMMSDALGVDALQKGYVDAIMAPELHATMGIDAGYHVIVDLAQYNMPMAGSSFQVDREWLKNNRDVARRFIKATVQALAMLKTDKDSAFRAMGKWYQMKDPELMEHFYDEASKVPSKPYAPVEGLKKMMEIYDSHEMRKYTVEHFYDDSFVRELDESGYIDSLYKDKK